MQFPFRRNIFSAVSPSFLGKFFCPFLLFTLIAKYRREERRKEEAGNWHTVARKGKGVKTSGWRPPTNPPSFLSTWLFFQQPFAFLLPTLPQSTLTPGPSRPKRRETPPDIQDIIKEVHRCRENYIVTEDSPK